ncbi:Putative pumilio homolog 8- chloroplastic [Striga hermonthica]|uniref:Pumilio homolog 8- chloroplastic n=1 Tax=Striga hermonthica TaxID=68872 RepID=A0A9N7R730_STRHE|nr:Putative pumilio homolog 8- chloroplastic [Striga hermonthica]
MESSASIRQNPVEVFHDDPYENSVTKSFQNLGLRDHSAANSSSSVRTQWLSPNSVCDRQSIWGYCFFTHDEGDGFETSRGFGWDTRNQTHEHDRFAAGPLALGYRFTGIEDDSWSGEWSGYEFDASRIRTILRGEQCELKETLICSLQRFVFALMTDEKKFFVFKMLVDACNGSHLDSLVHSISLESELFVEAAFREQGVKSIGKLINKVKKSRHAFILTQILSTRFFDLMTDNTARKVIQQCFMLLGHEQNEILYERTIVLCRELATHKIGCRSLNECIDTIAGRQRSILLNDIADASEDLSIDPYGNYVVQKVLDLKNSDVTSRILCVLRGKHIVLARNKVGSNVVEKCMMCSEVGLLDVVNELLSDPKTPFQLAQDHFGNYVIQKALLRTKESDDLREMYKSMVKLLKPYKKELERTAGGRNVMNLIVRDEGSRSTVCRNTVENRDFFACKKRL